MRKLANLPLRWNLAQTKQNGGNSVPKWLLRLSRLAKPRWLSQKKRGRRLAAVTRDVVLSNPLTNPFKCASILFFFCPERKKTIWIILIIKKKRPFKWSLLFFVVVLVKTLNSAAVCNAVGSLWCGLFLFCSAAFATYLVQRKTNKKSNQK